jgi:high-affinity iron transporter
VLPTFVIGLREGVEASLIVGIVAAFLIQQGRRDALRTMWLGVIGAIVLCVAAGVILEIVNQNLPQQQQEGLETVVALIAVGMVTYMILFMRRHARGLKGEIERHAGSALATGSAAALVLMAFLAVLREGLETVVFLLAAFQASTAPLAAGMGAVLGIVVAVILGWGIYRGGMRINLARFFKVTGFVLVLVAAGLMSFAAHTAHEAGWLNAGQAQFADFSAVIRPGTISAALFTGVLGIQPKPTWSEAIAWLVYFVPMSIIVLWPARRVRSTPTSTTSIAASA